MDGAVYYDFLYLRERFHHFLFLIAYKQEAVKKICSWQYANCIDLWVTYISHYIHDYDLQPLLYIIIQIINGMAILFPGPRYLPLRRKCIEWLNHLSSSSGIFIPVTSLALDVLEYKVSKEVGKPGKDFNFSSAVKVKFPICVIIFECCYTVYAYMLFSIHI